MPGSSSRPPVVMSALQLMQRALPIGTRLLGSARSSVVTSETTLLPHSVHDKDWKRASLACCAGKRMFSTPLSRAHRSAGFMAFMDPACPGLKR